MQTLHCEEVLLGGSGVVISRVITPVIWVISIVNLLITLLITTHEPPSRVYRVWVFEGLLRSVFQSSSPLDLQGLGFRV